jgi:hypothetical protein
MVVNTKWTDPKYWYIDNDNRAHLNVNGQVIRAEGEIAHWWNFIAMQLWINFLILMFDWGINMRATDEMLPHIPYGASIPLGMLLWFLIWRRRKRVQIAIIILQGDPHEHVGQ